MNYNIQNEQDVISDQETVPTREENLFLLLPQLVRLLLIQLERGFVFLFLYVLSVYFHAAIQHSQP